MITPNEARAVAASAAEDPRSPVRQFEAKIDDALMRAATDGMWPATISLSGVSPKIRQVFEMAYREAGWKVEILLDWRRGDFMHLESP